MKTISKHRLIKLFALFALFAFVFAMAIPPASIQAQDTPAPKTGDAGAFDFWVGKWQLTWNDKDGKVATGKNSIRKILKNKIIREKFEALTGSLKGYRGKSFSAYNPVTNTWKQTWVDTQGAYLDFTGKIEGDKRIFHREFVNPKKQTVQQRMVFYNIGANEFDWDWENSLDKGKTWKLQWRIHYKRAPKKDKKDKKGKKKKKKNKKDDSE